MTIIYCDLCGRALETGDVGCRVWVSEFKKEACDECAKKLISFIKTGPYKTGASNAVSR